MNPEIMLKVSTQAMRETADKIKGSLGTIRAAFESLDTTVSQTTNYWESKAADYHRNTYSGFKEKMNSAVSRIDQQITSLGQMAGVYEQSETSNITVSEDLPDDLIM